jgi:hypothetical protein
MIARLPKSEIDRFSYRPGNARPVLLVIITNGGAKMSESYIPVHQTVTTRINDGESCGWEFKCHICGYHARYLIRGSDDEGALEVIEVGDPHARHTNNHGQPVQQEEEWLNQIGYSQDHDDLDFESWLSPDSRKFLERLTQRLD